MATKFLDLTGLTSVISRLKTLIAAKQDKVSGGASTILSSNLTASRALVSNASGKVAASPVTSTELGYLDGVTSNIQTQLDGKAAKTHTHTIAQVTNLQSSLDGKQAKGSYLKTDIASTQTVTGYVNFTAGAGSTSDIRFKTNIRTLTDVLESLDRISLIEYDWSVPGQEHHTIGFDARDFLTYYPSLVHRDKDGRLSLEYPKLGAIALQACKELKREVSELKSEIAELRSRHD